MATTDSSTLSTRLEQTILKGRHDALLNFIHDLGTELTLQQILDELVDDEDKEYVLSLKPAELVRTSPGPNGHATNEHARLVPPLPSPSPRAAPTPRATKPAKAKPAAKPPKPAAKKAAKKPAAKAAKKPAAKKTAKAKPAAKKAGKKTARAAAPASAAPAAAAPAAAPSAARSLKAQVAEAVNAHVTKLAKGTRFKTSDVLLALGTTNDDVSKRTKIVAQLKVLEQGKVLTHEGDGRAAQWVVV